MTNWSLWEQVRQYWNLEPIVARPLTRMAVVEKIHCGGGDIITGLFKRRSPEGFMESYVSLRREKDRAEIVWIYHKRSSIHCKQKHWETSTEPEGRV
jgi:hypothetical protein